MRHLTTCAHALRGAYQRQCLRVTLEELTGGHSILKLLTAH
jgi:hypothetical protein